VLGGNVWTRHTGAAAGSYPWSVGHHKNEVRVNVTKLYFVPAKDLNSPVLVFEENPGLCKSWQGKRYVWSVRDWRTHMKPSKNRQQFCWCVWLN
jgi:hypothetical protein